MVKIFLTNGGHLDGVKPDENGFYDVSESEFQRLKKKGIAKAASELYANVPDFDENAPENAGMSDEEKDAKKKEVAKLKKKALASRKKR